MTHCGLLACRMFATDNPRCACGCVPCMKACALRRLEIHEANLNEGRAVRELLTSLANLGVAAEVYRMETSEYRIDMNTKLELSEAALRKSEEALRKSEAEVRRMTIVARAGWESARALAIAGLHRATERAADEALGALDAGLL